MWTSQLGVVVVAAVLAGSIAGAALAQGTTSQRAALAFLVAWAALAGTLSGILAGRRRPDQHRR